TTLSAAGPQVVLAIHRTVTDWRRHWRQYRQSCLCSCPE
ncbi:hypothetical protein JMJ77_0008756, partial [Colletotrichum scovillei]